MNMDITLQGAVPLDPAYARQEPPGGKRTVRLAIYAVLFVLDTGALLAVLVAAGRLWREAPFDRAGAGLLVIVPVYLCLAAQRSLYSARIFEASRRTMSEALSAWVMAIGAVAAIGLCLDAGSPASPGFLATAAVGGGVVLLLVRTILYAQASAWTAGEPISTIVIADATPVSGAAGVTVVEPALCGFGPDVGDPRALDRFGTVARRAERVVVACPPDRREAWAAMLKGANVQGEIVMSELAALGSLRASTFGGEPTLVVSLGPLDTRNRVLKRGFDVAVGSVLLAATWPLLLATAIAIKLDSEGPIVFRQQRMGRGNRLFSVYKFRSMRTDLCDAAGATSTARGDPRVTRVGRLIRATSIDELPQIFNVLEGTMSIVGPRPHALGSLAGDKLFWEVDGRYWDRHAMKPGITGLAQVHGHRGATAQWSDLEKRLTSDLAYMRGWTIWRDLRILLATASVIVHRNAF